MKDRSGYTGQEHTSIRLPTGQSALFMNRPLTKQQQLVYDFIREQIVVRGYGPTVREIGTHMDIKSPNGVMCHLRALERKGMITRAANKSRAIELTEPISRIVGANLPVAGSVLGGSCLPITNPDQPPFDVAAMAQPGSCVYRVLDDSLTDVNIVAGDYLVIKSHEAVANGTLCVVRTGDSTHVRFWFTDGGRIRLNPVNRQSSPMIVDEAVLVGAVVGAVRNIAVRAPDPER